MGRYLRRMLIACLPLRKRFPREIVQFRLKDCLTRVLCGQEIPSRIFGSIAINCSMAFRRTSALNASNCWAGLGEYDFLVKDEIPTDNAGHSGQFRQDSWNANEVCHCDNSCREGGVESEEKAVKHDASC